MTDTLLVTEAQQASHSQVMKASTKPVVSLHLPVLHQASLILAHMRPLPVPLLVKDTIMMGVGERDQYNTFQILRKTLLDILCTSLACKNRYFIVTLLRTTRVVHLNGLVMKK